MKARIITSILLVVEIALLNIGITYAATDATITITMSGPTAIIIDVVDISAAPATWGIKPVNLNSSYSKVFTLSNNGNVRVDTTIVGTDASGSGYHWVLADYAADNQYAIEYTVEGQVGIFNVVTTPVDFVQNLDEGQSRNFLLLLRTPASGDIPGEGGAMQATVTIQAVAG